MHYPPPEPKCAWGNKDNDTVLSTGEKLKESVLPHFASEPVLMAVLHQRLATDSEYIYTQTLFPFSPLGHRAGLQRSRKMAFLLSTQRCQVDCVIHQLHTHI